MKSKGKYARKTAINCTKIGKCMENSIKMQNWRPKKHAAKNQISYAVQYVQFLGYKFEIRAFYTKCTTLGAVNGIAFSMHWNYDFFFVHLLDWTLPYAITILRLNEH